jgi:hypothetical protein
MGPSNVRWAAPKFFGVPETDDTCGLPKLESDILLLSVNGVYLHTRGHEISPVGEGRQTFKT